MALINNHIIAAVATAPMAAGVAIVRISGVGAKELADKLCPSFAGISPRKMHFGKLVTQENTLDEGLLVWFAAPNSFTGEEVVEFHGHGGRAVVKAVLDAFFALGAKPAEAGEFTRRAFLNGKLDLTQAEGLADLVAASTEQQRQQALRQMGGELGNKFEQWRADIMHLVAHAEAAIDFPDEELDVLTEAGLDSKVDCILSDFTIAITNQTGQRLRDGFIMAVIGQPNSGKSTLTNLLTGRDTAIVSPIAGTTRDVVESHLDIAGYPVILADTAGLRVASDVIEIEGINRAGKKAQEADLVLLVTDAAKWPNLDPQVTKFLKGKEGVILVSKTDITPVELPKDITIDDIVYNVIGVDLTNPAALPTILELIRAKLDDTFANTTNAAQLTRQRHRQAVYDATTHLKRAQELLAACAAGGSFSADMLAQDLRDAANAIGQVTGRTDTEDVLDLVFSTFCIGK